MVPSEVVTFARKGYANFEYTVSQVQEGLRRKLILPNDSYWLTGMSEWRPVTELEALIVKMNSTIEEPRRAEVSLTTKSEIIVVTTTPSVQGYRVVRYLGITRGIVVRTPNILEGISGGIAVIIGAGRVSAYAVMCEKTRLEAYNAMLADAQVMGANAIIGVAYDANEVMERCTEVLCYGTAVIIERE